ncbi:hypothetical protein AVEN_192075-1 [Araneus ventricosus]|uniref:Uncharacterized protein n=1 Tax=Araneus ventricosus TaxID=182803 RepID=A0A4Y2B7D2_ARAVE|nr:hypothetical protein AVEN_192075-1 [Araneus ventricosus]
MRQELWGPEIHNHRISDQAATLVSFILKYDLIIWNDKDSEPTFEKDEDVWNFDKKRGVPQGSCSEPLFWNLVMDTALDLPLPQGCHIQAYAGDIIVVIRSKDKEEIETKGKCNSRKITCLGCRA